MSEATIADRCRVLISTGDEASRVGLATSILGRYADLPDDEKVRFFGDLVRGFEPDSAVPDSEIAGRRRELLHRLSEAPGGTAALVRLRADLLHHLQGDRALAALDADFQPLLDSWFDRDSLVLQPITWSSPAELREKVIAYESVHPIADGDELRRRLEPPDRRCYAFLHPALPGEPLVFVEVALTRGIPDAITDLLDDRRDPIAGEAADTAVFYSINNCHAGLRGLSFGHLLIQQVSSELTRDLPNLTTFVTLSPAPGFGRWLRDQAGAGNLDADELLHLIASDDWARDPVRRERQAALATALGTTYVHHAQRADGRPLDPVARFHLGNGAVVERINPQGNLSPSGIEQSAGMMVNYRYDRGPTIGV
ncbi:MAG: malonyl-CoA decarboxylase family protein [Acidimicrobiia bacterium]|nr:malonyl-CoA decarboxylase family protein [Acidimicrobiia bacterium]